VLELDGSRGEGGGQILRTALALSVITGRPFRIDRIRANRKNPGLRRQHLTAVKAAARIGSAEVKGAALDSRRLTFVPGPVAPGEYEFSIGTAGSATLVLQTILPPLLVASGPSRLVIEGGTHNPQAPPFHFIERVYLPLLRQMGPRVSVRLDRHGFFPAGGGRFRVTVEPVPDLSPLDLGERGDIKRRRARALIARLPTHVAERELKVVKQSLGWDRAELEVVEVRDSAGPGNALMLEIESAHATELITAFGRRGVPAEKVAGEAVAEAQRYLESGAPVGEHLADQLLLPLAIAGGGSFATLPLTPHARTNLEVLRSFLALEVSEEQRELSCHVTLRRSGPLRAD
jgi:RNA 3'-terminal phosphate cyclase (ATP)